MIEEIILVLSEIFAWMHWGKKDGRKKKYKKREEEGKQETSLQEN